MWIPIPVILVGILCFVGWLFSSGRIVVRRKPKIKLTEEGRKFYNECERLLLPFYEEYREIYTEILSNVEIELDLLDQIVHEAEPSTEAYASAKYLLDESIENKYYIWALDRICYELKEIRKSSKGYLYERKDGFKKLCNNLYAKLEELEKKLRRGKKRYVD